MFTTPLEEADLTKVEQFCRTFSEGVRVEYKSEPVHIEKIVSSLANTLGGIWVIGVRTDHANRPIFPLEGMPRRPGIEEQIVQICQTRIYPPLTPAVCVIDVPSRQGTVLAIVKVAESLEAPHTIENSTKVYVRVASTTPPYDLAEIDRIEYLLKRRQTREKEREQLIADAAQRSPFKDQSRRVQVVVAPVYPRGFLLPVEDLYGAASVLEQRGASQFLRQLRRFPSGFLSSLLVSETIRHHLEFTAHGVGLLDVFLDPRKATGRGREYPCFNLIDLLFPVASLVNVVCALLKGQMANVLLRAVYYGCENISFSPLFKSGDMLIDVAMTMEEHKCLSSVVHAETFTLLETLLNKRIEVQTELMRQMLWAFNFEDADLQNKVGLTLRNNGLV